MKKELAIVGIPRCGTTFLYRSVAHLLPGNYSPAADVYNALPIIKVHSLAPPHTFEDPYAKDIKELVESGGDIIFLFGDPVEAIISTKMKQWNTKHAFNCGYVGELEKTDIYAKDFFNYEKMFDTWMNTKGYQVLCMRYETMDANFGYVEEYLKRKIQWNPWRLRNTNKNFVYLRTLKKIEHTYARLIKKVQMAKDVELRGEI